MTNRLTSAAERQEAAVGANFKTQNLTLQLYRGGLANSLEVIYAQLGTLEARISSVEIKTELLKSSVELVRAFGGGGIAGNCRRMTRFNRLAFSNIPIWINQTRPVVSMSIQVNHQNHLII